MPKQKFSLQNKPLLNWTVNLTSISSSSFSESSSEVCKKNSLNFLPNCILISRQLFKSQAICQNIMQKVTKMKKKCNEQTRQALNSLNKPRVYTSMHWDLYQRALLSATLELARQVGHVSVIFVTLNQFLAIELKINLQTMANDSSVFDSNSGQDCESTEKFKKIPVTRNGEGMLPS